MHWKEKQEFHKFIKQEVQKQIKEALRVSSESDAKPLPEKDLQDNQPVNTLDNPSLV